MKIAICRAADIPSLPQDHPSTRFYSVSVPLYFTEMCSIVDPSQGCYSSKPLKISYQLSFFVAREMRAVFGDVPPMHIADPGNTITTTGAAAEWLVERQGWTHTLRLRARTNIVEHELMDEIDEEALIFSHDRHTAIKFRTPEARLLASIRYGEYCLEENANSSIEDLSQPIT
jgi:hypothetical protein